MDDMEVESYLIPNRVINSRQRRSLLTMCGGIKSGECQRIQRIRNLLGHDCEGLFPGETRVWGDAVLGGYSLDNLEVRPAHVYVLHYTNNVVEI